MISDDLSQGYYKESGTVLLRKEDSKGGRSLLLFLRGFGPRWASAPSSGGKNRFGGAAEPMVWGSFSLYQSPARLYLQSADIKEDFLALRSSPAALSCAARLYRLTANEAPSGCSNDGLLRALWNAMLELRGGAKPAAVEFRYMWRLLAVMGTAPSLSICAGCGGELAGGALFTGEGLLCENCARGAKGTPVSERELSVLRAAAGLPHDKFVEWAAKCDAKEIYAANIKKLSSYFRNLR